MSDIVQVTSGVKYFYYICFPWYHGVICVFIPGRVQTLLKYHCFIWQTFNGVYSSVYFGETNTCAISHGGLGSVDCILPWECADSISQDLWNICFHIKTMWFIRMQHDCYQPNKDFKNICIQKQFCHSLGGLDSLVCCTRGTLLLPRISGFPDSHIPQCILTSVVLGPFAIGSTIHNLTNDWSIKYPDLNLPAYRL